MAIKLARVDPTLAVPTIPDHGVDDEARKKLMGAINSFALEAVQAHSKNLANSVEYAHESYVTVRRAYIAMLGVGLVALLASILVGLSADGSAEAVSATATAVVSGGIVVATLVLKPAESMERNAILLPWIMIALNSYWLRLAYFSDPAKADEQLKAAAADASITFALILEKHATAIALENERLRAMKEREAEEDEGESDEAGSDEPAEPPAGDPADPGGDAPPAQPSGDKPETP